ncbi:MAG: peptidase M75 [Muribaculaceae bacterium]|nr:peptidase M75 [Muribaculaceae bacterium]
MKAIELFKNALMLVTLAGMTLGFAACSDSNDDPDPNQLDSKKTAIITQYVNGVVVPTYKSLADEANELAALCQQLRENPTQGKVQECCDKWISARKYWELSEAFLFGAAADYNIDPHIDSWPLQKSQLDNILNNSSLIAALDEDGAGADAFATLGYGLLGFHAVEYVLFRDGAARNVGDITERELIYNAAVAQDLANQTVRLEASWAGMNNISSAKRAILEEHELEPSFNYGENMIDAGKAGNSLYKTQLAAMEQILTGASDISDEVGNTKITDPVNSGNVLDVESWYSWNSIADFTDNIRSVRNAYYGSLDGTVNNNSLAAYMNKVNASLDSNVRSAIDNAIKEVSCMPAPFRNHLSKSETQKAVDACNQLLDALDAAIEGLK